MGKRHGLGSGGVMKRYMKIPLMTDRGLCDLKFEPHEFGDPHSVTITIPEACEGKLQLPRSLFGIAFNRQLRTAFMEGE
jgi:hypothetical protein